MTATETSTVDEKGCELPAYMGLNSRGPAVDLVLSFLFSWALDEGYEVGDLVIDGHYGEIAVKWMMEFQNKTGVEGENGGVFGPKTREKMAGEYNFDFALAAQHLPKVTLTSFVYDLGLASPPCGFFWAPGLPRPIGEMGLAVARLRNDYPEQCGTGVVAVYL